MQMGTPPWSDARGRFDGARLLIVSALAAGAVAAVMAGTPWLPMLLLFTAAVSVMNAIGAVPPEKQLNTAYAAGYCLMAAGQLMECWCLPRLVSLAISLTGAAIVLVAYPRFRPRPKYPEG